MKVRIYKLTKNKFLVFSFILSLFAFWLASSLILSSETPFTVLKEEHGFNKYKAERLLKRHKVAGEFKSNKDYLGIIYVNFEKYIKPNFELEDQIEFRLKEKGSRSWLHEQKYRSGSFENLNLFPFGIPIINDSKGKIYQFEVESLNGNTTNALTLSSTDPKVIYSYHIPIDVIKNNLPKYLFDKSINSFIRIEFLLSSVIFALPLIYFVLLFTYLNNKKILMSKKYILFSILLILIDIFLINIMHLGVLLAIAVIYLVAIFSNKIESKFNFLFAFSLVIIWVILNYFNIINYTDKLNVWTYFLLVVGTGQIFYEIKFKPKNLKDINYFIKKHG